MDNLGVLGAPQWYLNNVDETPKTYDLMTCSSCSLVRPQDTIVCGLMGRTEPSGRIDATGAGSGAQGANSRLQGAHRGRQEQVLMGCSTHGAPSRQHLDDAKDFSAAALPSAPFAGLPLERVVPEDAGAT